MRNITKEFPGVKALNDITLNIKNGEIHALCGENGAGKSTLIKILSGVYPHNSFNGEIFINGKKIIFENTQHSEKAGIAIIYQELALVEELSIAENIFLGHLDNNAGVVRWDSVFQKANKLLTDIGIKLDLNKKVKDIGVGQQQMVEIAKALSLNADILIMDEPTAALTEIETDLLFNVIGRLKANGVTCVLISHKLEEVFEIADRITILRDGSLIGTYEINNTNEESVVNLMVGRVISQRFPFLEKEISDRALEVKNFTKYKLNDSSKAILKNISFYVRKGEILGIAGLIGAGRTELLTSMFGFLKGKQEGELFIDGKKIIINDPRDAILFGMGLVSEDRKRYGLILEQSVVKNITLASLESVSKYGVIKNNLEIHKTNSYVSNIGIKTHSIEFKVDSLSGGNQQKVLLARCLMTKPKILFLDEPTRGIDVGAKFEIYTLINELAAKGTAIVMVSSELSEVIGMSDRILVLYEGEIKAEFSKEEASQEKIMTVASGDTIH